MKSLRPAPRGRHVRAYVKGARHGLPHVVVSAVGPPMRPCRPAAFVSSAAGEQLSHPGRCRLAEFGGYSFAFRLPSGIVAVKAREHMTGRRNYSRTCDEKPETKAGPADFSSDR